MPTGYTRYIEDGCTFEEYVWRCARAFGACVLMRDEPENKDIPEAFSPSNYHQKSIDSLKKERSELESMTTEELQALVDKQIARVVAQNEESAAENAKLREIYAVKKREVEAWTPPTPDHAELKGFMLQQIEVSLPSAEPYQTPLPPNDVAKYKEERLTNIASDLNYHRTEQEKELKRTSGRNGWITALRASVPQPKFGEAA